MTNHTLVSDRQLRAVPEKHKSEFIYTHFPYIGVISFHVSNWATLTYEWEITRKDAKYAVTLHCK